MSGPVPFANVHDEFRGLETGQVPGHTCAMAGSPRTGTGPCARCMWICEQFAVWFPQFLSASPGAALEGPDSPEGQRFIRSITCLADAQLTLMSWWHCTVICLQLESAPVKTEREKLGWLLDEQPVYQLTLDVIDRMFTAATTGENAQKRIAELVKDFGRADVMATHLVLANMAVERLKDRTSPFQRAAHQMLMHDARMSANYPHELLLAARIAGACAADDHTEWSRLLSRAARFGSAPRLAAFWAYGCARHIQPGQEIRIMLRDGNGLPDMFVTQDAELADVSGNPVGRGAVMAMKLVSSIANGSGGSGQIRELLGEDEVLAGDTVQALSHWYSEYVRGVTAQVSTPAE